MLVWFVGLFACENILDIESVHYAMSWGFAVGSLGIALIIND